MSSESSSIRQKAYALLSLLEPDLIEILNLLNDRIQEKVHSSNSIVMGVEHDRNHQIQTPGQEHLKGFVTVRLTQVDWDRDIAVQEKKRKRWLNMPSRSYTDSNGKQSYSYVLDFLTKRKKTSSKGSSADAWRGHHGTKAKADLFPTSLPEYQSKQRTFLMSLKNVHSASWKWRNETTLDKAPIYDWGKPASSTDLQPGQDLMLCGQNTRVDAGRNRFCHHQRWSLHRHWPWRRFDKGASRLRDWGRWSWIRSSHTQRNPFRKWSQDLLRGKLPKAVIMGLRSGSSISLDISLSPAMWSTDTGKSNPDMLSLTL